jgi:hypothetical protein
VTLNDSVFTVTNNGNDEITLFVTINGSSNGEITDGDLAFYVAQSELDTSSDFTDAKNISALNNAPNDVSGDQRHVIDSEPNGVVLGSGDSVTVGLFMNTKSITTNNTQLFASSDAVTFTANATDSTNDGVLEAKANQATPTSTQTPTPTATPTATPPSTSN